jgi:peptidoglycan/LPS O-acetylase OafA/YrhL
MAYLILWAAWRLPFRRFDLRWDVSYGVYIYAFPVQQGLALLGAATLPVALLFPLALAATLPFAFASYVLIERPALRLKSWTPSIRGRQPAEPPPHGVDALSTPASVQAIPGD